MDYHPNYNPQALKKREISLTRILSNALNQPRYTHKDGDFPLYPHSEDSKIVLNRPPNWHKLAINNYNSPSNIRTLCLSIDGANIFYWAPVVKGGKHSAQVLSGDYTLDRTGKAGIKQKLDPNKYAFANTGLQALVNPVVLSNLEELWITDELLNTPNYITYYNQLNNLQPGQVAGVDFLTTILEAEISTPSKPRTVADTFPLLRAIVVVKLPPNTTTLDFHKLATRNKLISQELNTLYPNQRRAVGEAPPLLKELAKQTGVGIASQPILTGNITKFSLGSYKYDAQVLSALRDRLVNKYKTKDKGIEDRKEMPNEANSEKEDETLQITQQSPPDTQPQDEEPLIDVIKSLEQTSTSTIAIKKVLFALRTTQPDYFKRQTPLLPESVRKKYQDALQ